MIVAFAFVMGMSFTSFATAPQKAHGKTITKAAHLKGKTSVAAHAADKSKTTKATKGMKTKPKKNTMMKATGKKMPMPKGKTTTKKTR